MDTQQNIGIVRRGYEAFGRGDLDELLSLFDDNIQWTSPGPAGLLPTAGTRQGREQVAGFFKAVNETFEIQRFEPQTFLADGDRVIVLGDDTARVKATGKVLIERWAHAFTLKNGKIVAFEEYMDTSAVVAELRAAHAST